MYVSIKRVEKQAVENTVLEKYWKIESCFLGPWGFGKWKFFYLSAWILDFVYFNFNSVQICHQMFASKMLEKNF